MIQFRILVPAILASVIRNRENVNLVRLIRLIGISPVTHTEAPQEFTIIGTFGTKNHIQIAPAIRRG